MIVNKRFAYRAMDRVTRADGVRHYVDPDTGAHLPSVTTILSATADHKELLEWREFVGDKKADQVRDEACALGNLMHEHLENFVLDIPRPRGSNLIRTMSKNMSDKIIEQGLCHVDEVWGCEIALHTPPTNRHGGWAGTTDLVGQFCGVPAILDYKTAKKMKSYRDKVVQDYAAQAAAYCFSHNQQYGTAIKTCVIFMVDRKLNFETFLVDGSELEKATARWLERREDYEKKCSQA